MGEGGGKDEKDEMRKTSSTERKAEKKDGWTDRRTDGRTDGQTERQTDTLTDSEPVAGAAGQSAWCSSKAVLSK